MLTYISCVMINLLMLTGWL